MVVGPPGERIILGDTSRPIVKCREFHALLKLHVFSRKQQQCDISLSVLQLLVVLSATAKMFTS